MVSKKIENTKESRISNSLKENTLIHKTFLEDEDNAEYTLVDNLKLVKGLCESSVNTSPSKDDITFLRKSRSKSRKIGTEVRDDFNSGENSSNFAKKINPSELITKQQKKNSHAETNSDHRGHANEFNATKLSLPVPLKNETKVRSSAGSRFSSPDNKSYKDSDIKLQNEVENQQKRTFFRRNGEPRQETSHLRISPPKISRSRDLMKKPAVSENDPKSNHNSMNAEPTSQSKTESEEKNVNKIYTPNRNRQVRSEKEVTSKQPPAVKIDDTKPVKKLPPRIKNESTGNLAAENANQNKLPVEENKPKVIIPQEKKIIEKRQENTQKPANVSARSRTADVHKSHTGLKLPMHKNNLYNIALPTIPNNFNGGQESKNHTGATTPMNNDLSETVSVTSQKVAQDKLDRIREREEAKARMREEKMGIYRSKNNISIDNNNINLSSGLKTPKANNMSIKSSEFTYNPLTPNRPNIDKSIVAERRNIYNKNNTPPVETQAKKDNASVKAGDFTFNPLTPNRPNIDKAVVAERKNIYNKNKSPPPETEPKKDNAPVKSSEFTFNPLTPNRPNVDKAIIAERRNIYNKNKSPPVETEAKSSEFSYNPLTPNKPNVEQAVIAERKNIYNKNKSPQVETQVKKDDTTVQSTELTFNPLTPNKPLVDKAIVAERKNIYNKNKSPQIEEPKPVDFSKKRQNSSPIKKSLSPISQLSLNSKVLNNREVSALAKNMNNYGMNPAFNNKAISQNRSSPEKKEIYSKSYGNRAPSNKLKIDKNAVNSISETKSLKTPQNEKKVVEFKTPPSNNKKVDPLSVYNRYNQITPESVNKDTDLNLPTQESTDTPINPLYNKSYGYRRRAKEEKTLLRKGEENKCGSSEKLATYYDNHKCEKKVSPTLKVSPERKEEFVKREKNFAHRNDALVQKTLEGIKNNSRPYENNARNKKPNESKSVAKLDHKKSNLKSLEVSPERKAKKRVQIKTDSTNKLIDK